MSRIILPADSYIIVNKTIINESLQCYINLL